MASATNSAAADGDAARRPRLRSILLVVNLVILALPLGGIALLRLYESALIRQTESELIAQGAFVAAAYKASLLRGRGAASTAAAISVPPANELWRPQPAQLDLAVDPVLAPAPPAQAPTARPDARALASGRETMALMREAQSVTLAAIRVVDPQGIVVASTGEELGMSLADRTEVQRALSGAHVSLLRTRTADQPAPGLASISRSTGVRVFVAAPIVDGRRVLGAVVLARTPASLVQTLYRKGAHILYAVLTLLGVVVAVSLFTAFTISRPLAAVIRQTERARRGETGAVVPLARPVTREVAQLSGAVADLARTLEQRAAYIRDFAAHVSHEFKTPLTAIQGAVELLRDHGDSMAADERRRFLDNLAADTERLERLVRRLLELARADTAQPGTESAAADAVLRRVVERYRARGMRVTLEPDSAAGIRVAMADDTLDSILTNLLDNARQHGGQDVGVSLGATPVMDQDRPMLAITVRDDGPGVSPANAARVFQPFFTTARGQGGTGLGLAVVRALLAAHHGDIRLLAGEGPGAGFALRLPLRAGRGGAGGRPAGVVNASAEEY